MGASPWRLFTSQVGSSLTIADAGSEVVLVPEQPSFEETLAAVARPEARVVAVEAERDRKNRYTDQQVVELVVQTGYYFHIGRITTVFDLEIDAPQDARVFDAGANAAEAEPSGDSAAS